MGQVLENWNQAIWLHVCTEKSEVPKWLLRGTISRGVGQPYAGSNKRALERGSVCIVEVKYRAELQTTE